MTLRSQSASPLALIGVEAALMAASDASFQPRATLLQKEFDLTGRVAVVTGGNRGLGLEMAEALCEAGAIVYCFDLPTSPGPEWTATHSFVERLGLEKARLEYERVDVTDQKGVWAAVEKIAEKEGRIDIGVAAAGVVYAAESLEYSAEEFTKVINVNVNGVLYTAQAVGRQMAKFGTGGSIIMISSIMGSLASKDVACIGYNTSKSAMLQMARSMACELGPKKIRVNTISPGYIHTAITATFLDHRPELLESWSKQNPLGRIGRPDELRGAIAWLASDASTFCSGSDIVIDGGNRAW